MCQERLDGARDVRVVLTPGGYLGRKGMTRQKQSRAKSNAKATGGGDPHCTFCGRSHADVAKLVGGPGVYICDGCVGLCNDILADEANQDTSGGWKGWESMTDEDLLVSLRGILSSVENVREGLQARIDELRRREVSWARIGESLGMSRQAAWERFA
jgi:hypothetical protein